MDGTVFEFTHLRLRSFCSFAFLRFIIVRLAVEIANRATQSVNGVTASNSALVDVKTPLLKFLNRLADMGES